MDLTADQQELLEFERRWPRHCAAKLQAVREFFDLPNADYEKLIARVLELPAAERYDPELVRQVRRQRRALRWFVERQSVEWH